MKKNYSLLILFGILFVSFNLRAPITAVGSVVEMIQNEYHLSNAAAGFITTLPLIAFAVVSPFVSTISDKIGHSMTMMIGLIFILIGEFCRSYTNAAGLFIGTAIIGIGIAIGNVIIPGIIKLHFSDKVGFVTSIYTSGMCIFAALGAGVSIPLAKGLSLGWKNTLCVWAVLTIITMLIWFPQTRHSKVNVTKNSSSKTSSLWKSPLAWWVTLFMGTQSLLFYSLVAWLPTIVMSKNMSQNFAGNMALLFQLMAIPATLIIPSLCDRFKDQRILIYVVCALYALGMILFLTGSTPAVITTAVIFMSIGMGGSISLSIAFISLRSPNSQRAAQLSGMSQSAGYLLAAVGPILTGFIYDIRSSWTIPIVLFILLILFLGFCGFFAGHGLCEN